MVLECKRKFELSICIDGPYGQWINEVISGIENDSLMVFDSKEVNPFRDIYRYKDIDKFVEERAKVKINISEYLPLACQCIRFIDEEVDIELKKEREEKPGIFASCWSNIRRAILPKSFMIPLGPSAFISEIVLHNIIVHELSRYKCESEKPFKYLISHEFVHAFNRMRFIVPAFLDWNEFWEKPLGCGSNCQNARQVLERLEVDIDCYGTDKELKKLKKYWPSNAENWFNAWQDMKKKK